MELENLLLNSIATIESAENRKESRGAHSREDFKDRDDKNWHYHIAVHNDGNYVRRDINMQPNEVEPILLKERDH